MFTGAYQQRSRGKSTSERFHGGKLQCDPGWKADSGLRYLRANLPGFQGSIRNRKHEIHANVEIAELVGKDNIFTFGESSEIVIARYERGDYRSKDWYEKDKDLKAAVDFIVGKDMMKIGQKENLDRLYKELLNKDWFMTFPDFVDYVKTREKAYEAYTDRTEWAKKMLINISKAGFFSSDRTIAQYNEEIWKLS